jgi:hypothetical protein
MKKAASLAVHALCSLCVSASPQVQGDTAPNLQFRRCAETAARSATLQFATVSVQSLGAHDFKVLFRDTPYKGVIPFHEFTKDRATSWNWVVGLPRAFFHISDYKVATGYSEWRNIPEGEAVSERRFIHKLSPKDDSLIDRTYRGLLACHSAFLLR